VHEQCQPFVQSSLTPGPSTGYSCPERIRHPLVGVLTQPERPLSGQKGTHVRKVLFWMHLTAGVTCGIVILIMCGTGAALAFEKQINAWLERNDARIVITAQGSARLPLEALLAKVQEQKPGSASAIKVRSGANEPVEVSMGR